MGLLPSKSGTKDTRDPLSKKTYSTILKSTIGVIEIIGAPFVIGTFITVLATPFLLSLFSKKYNYPGRKESVLTTHLFPIIITVILEFFIPIFPFWTLLYLYIKAREGS